MLVISTNDEQTISLPFPPSDILQFLLLKNKASPHFPT